MRARPLLIATILLAGCASAAVEQGARPATRTTMAASDHGLRIRQWRIVDDAGRVAVALTRHADGLAADRGALQRLDRNGFRFVRVRADDVDALLADLGGAAVDVDGWHGQVYEWQPIVTRPVGASGRALAVDGRVHRLEDGQLRLMLRGWTLPMEDGPALHVELVPEHDRTRATRYDQLLGRRRFAGERYVSSGLDVLLEAGWAYVLTCEIPGLDWGEIDEEDAARGMPVAVEPAPPGSGPDAPAPLTLGELLLRHEAMPQGRRDLLVLIPRVPDALYPTARQGGSS